MTDDEILINFYNQFIANHIRDTDPVLFNELHEKAHAAYLEEVIAGRIPRV